jgi:hypothetical protein
VPRAVRQRRNRELFRTVNDRIAEVASKLLVENELQGFICECSSVGCTSQIEVPSAVYGEVRETDGAYLVQPGHEEPDLEETIATYSTYLIVVDRSDG